MFKVQNIQVYIFSLRAALFLMKFTTGSSVVSLLDFFEENVYAKNL